MKIIQLNKIQHELEDRDVDVYPYIKTKEGKIQVGYCGVKLDEIVFVCPILKEVLRINMDLECCIEMYESIFVICPIKGQVITGVWNISGGDANLEEGYYETIGLDEDDEGKD